MRRSVLNAESSDAPAPNYSSSHGGRVARSTYLVLLLLLTVSVGLNVLLAHRVHQLGVATIGQFLQAQLQVGAFVPPIAAKGLDGQSEKITYGDSDRPTVLYIFTPQCGWCTRNMDNLKALLRAKGQDNRFIGVSLSPIGLAEYLRTHQLTIPVLTGLSSDTISAYKLGGTPQTLVISPKGQILQNWRGAWTNKQQSEIEAFFHITLPGIQLKSSASASLEKHL
jgi:peroxiredoxin